MDAAPLLYRTRPRPNPLAVAVGLLGFALLFNGDSFVIGLILIAAVVFSWWKSEVTLTGRYLKVRRGLFANTNELQLAKLETVQTGVGLGNAKPLSVVGTGGTVYRLGVIGNAGEFREKLQDAIERARSK